MQSSFLSIRRRINPARCLRLAIFFNQFSLERIKRHRWLERRPRFRNHIHRKIVIANFCQRVFKLPFRQRIPRINNFRFRPRSESLNYRPMSQIRPANPDTHQILALFLDFLGRLLNAYKFPHIHFSRQLQPTPHFILRDFFQNPRGFRLVHLWLKI